MKDASRSFGIQTAKDYLTHLIYPSFTEFSDNPTSPHRAIVCAIFTWHLHDWIWHQHESSVRTQMGVTSKKEFQNQLFAHDEFKAVSSIANGAKHLEVSDPRLSEITSAESVSGEYGSAPYGTFPYGSGGLIVHLDDGRIYTISQVLEACIKYWDNLLQNLQ